MIGKRKRDFLFSIIIVKTYQDTCVYCLVIVRLKIKIWLFFGEFFLYDWLKKYIKNYTFHYMTFKSECQIIDSYNVINDQIVHVEKYLIEVSYYIGY